MEFRAPSLYRAGICTGNLRDWTASETHYSRLIKEFANFEQVNEARYGLGMALQNQKKLDAAIQVFQQIIALETVSETAAKSWFMVGQCCFAQKKYRQAIDAFSEVAFGFKHAEWQPLSFFEAGRCYLQLKNKKAARKMLQTVVDEFPKHPRVKDAKAILGQIDTR